VGRDRYQDTVAYLQQLEVTSGWDLKLDRMRQALALLAEPQARFPGLHIAGTNGKGSVAAFSEAILRAAGYRTGLYTSPHLVDFSERIRAGGRRIPERTVVEIVDELRAVLDDAALALTHFELVTLLAFVWFARIGVDAAIVEVGLGGRLDATNLVSPAVTAITPIAHDHQAYLGADLTSIAAEKAGIIKPGVPVCVGVQSPLAFRVLEERAAEVGAPLLEVGRDGRLDAGVFSGPGALRWEGLAVGPRGRYQHDNAELALLTVAAAQPRWPVTVDAVRTGLTRTSWPGRLSVLETSPPVVLDGAHNPAAAAALARELPALVGGRRVRLVFATMSDKDWQGVLASLRPLVASVVVTRVGPRALDPETVVQALRGVVPVRAIPEPAAALRIAMAEASVDDVVLVTGSLFLVGEAYAELSGCPFEPWQGWGSDATDPLG